MPGSTSVATDHGTGATGSPSALGVGGRVPWSDGPRHVHPGRFRCLGPAARGGHLGVGRPRPPGAWAATTPTSPATSIEEAWDASIDAGVTFFDTAEVYGGGESERIIGSLLAGDPARAAKVVVATKFMPSPWKLNVQGAPAARRCGRPCGRLGLPAVDLYQIHGPISLRSHAALADALADAHRQGLVKAVGVSNYSVKETRSMAAALRTLEACPLATNQIEFSLLRRAPETGGLLAACAELGVRAPGLLADRPGSPHRQVLGRPPPTGQPHVLQPSDGGGRRCGGRASPHRRQVRGEAAEPGGPATG